MRTALNPGSPLDLAIKACKTSKELAQRLGVTASAVTQWKVKGEIPVERIPSVAKVTGIPLSLLLPEEFKDTATRS